MSETNRDTHTGPSFTKANRFARFFWNFTYILFFRFSLRPLHSWRAFLLRLFGAKLGRGCHIYPAARIWAPWNLECGDEVGVADHAILYNQAKIGLGYRAVISQGSHLCTGTHDYESAGFELHAHPISVASLVWIAAECFVAPGVSIGEGAVIGARSVVLKDMPSWRVCAGNPCRVIKERDPTRVRRSE